MHFYFRDQLVASRTTPLLTSPLTNKDIMDIHLASKTHSLRMQDTHSFLKSIFERNCWTWDLQLSAASFYAQAQRIQKRARKLEKSKHRISGQHKFVAYLEEEFQPPIPCPPRQTSPSPHSIPTCPSAAGDHFDHEVMKDVNEKLGQELAATQKRMSRKICANYR